MQHVRVGFDDEGRLLGLDVRIQHDHGAYTPYGIIVPIITSTQLLGPYKPGAYRVEFTSLYTNTVIVTPYRGAGRPQAAFCMERTMDRIADELGLDRTAVREANLIRPEEFPYDQGLIFQDGRPLIYDSGDYPEMLRRIKELIGWDDFAGAARRGGAGGTARRHRARLLRRGHRRRPVRGRPRRGRLQRAGARLDRPDLAGPGAPDGVRADRRVRAGRADRAT